MDESSVVFYLFLFVLFFIFFSSYALHMLYGIYPQILLTGLFGYQENSQGSGGGFLTFNSSHMGFEGYSFLAVVSDRCSLILRVELCCQFFVLS